ncbi:MAG TPA: hypothetical protein VIX20_11430 [Ktedonobacteraceae bacterium]
MNNAHQKRTIVRLETALIAFFVLAALMGIALIQVGIAIWILRIYFQYGVWGMGRKKQVKLPSRI